jgi:hypothetical protein
MSDDDSSSHNDQEDQLTMVEEYQRTKEQRRRRFLVVSHQDGDMKGKVKRSNNREAKMHYDLAAQHVLASVRKLMLDQKFRFQVEWCGALAAACATVFDVSSSFFLYR